MIELYPEHLLEEKCIKFYPCQRKDCEFYREWGLFYQKKENGFIDKTPSTWVTFGVTCCTQCLNYERINLFRPIKEV